MTHTECDLRDTFETWMMWRGGMWRYKGEDIRHFLRDDGRLAHGIVRPSPEGDRMTALATMQTQPDGRLIFSTGGAEVVTMPAGSDPAEVRTVWEALIASVGGTDGKEEGT